MKLYTYDEAHAVYISFMDDVKRHSSKYKVYLHRNGDQLELLGEADKGTGKHAFGFDRVFVTEETANKFKSEYGIKLIHEGDRGEL